MQLKKQKVYFTYLFFLSPPLYEFGFISMLRQKAAMKLMRNRKIVIKINDWKSKIKWPLPPNNNVKMAVPYKAKRFTCECIFWRERSYTDSDVTFLHSLQNLTARRGPSEEKLNSNTCHETKQKNVSHVLKLSVASDCNWSFSSY